MRAKKLGLDALVQQLKMVGDWLELENGGVCQYCGKVADQPYCISMVMDGFGMPEKEFVAMRRRHAKEAGRSLRELGYEREIKMLRGIETNRKETGYPDPGGKHHRHGKGKKDQFDPRRNPLFMKWVYLLKPEQGVIEVWRSTWCAERNQRLVSMWKKVSKWCVHEGMDERSPA